MMVMEVSGYSMYPLLKPGQRVLVRPMGRGERPRPGELVVLQSLRRELVVHRVLRVYAKRGVLVTQGDNTSAPDRPWPLRAVAGVVVGADREGVWMEPRGAVGAWMLSAQRAGLARWARLVLRWLGAAAWRRMPTGRVRTEPVSPRSVEKPAATGWILQQSGGELHLLDPVTGDCHVLSATARLIWEEARAGSSERQIVGALARLYKDADEDLLQSDVHRTLGELRRLALL